MIRLLKPNEIECRVQSTHEKPGKVSAIILLYKDARTDMDILDETFGMFGWKRRHELINGNLFCVISIWDDVNKQWVEKEDVGTESNTEKEKGQASDSFKRAGTNVGIGRELYTAPFIWLDLESTEVRQDTNGKSKVNRLDLQVSKIGYNEDREINLLELSNSKGVVRYTWTNAVPSKPVPSKPEPTIDNIKVLELTKHAKDKGFSADQLLEVINKRYKKKITELTEKEYQEIIKRMDK